MNARIGLLMLVVGAGALWAQTTSTATPATPAAGPQKAAPAKPAKSATTPTAKPTATATTATTTTKTTTKTAKKTTKPAASKKQAEKPAEKPAAGAATASAVEEKPKTSSVSAQKRDPFISPITTHINGPINCGTGKRCLVVDQTVLQGVVKAPNGMIAVVSNSANKAYFLRENDPVYNGFVMRITPDSVVFREQVTDRLGRTSTREVVKKVIVPAV